MKIEALKINIVTLTENVSAYGLIFIYMKPYYCFQFPKVMPILMISFEPFLFQTIYFIIRSIASVSQCPRVTRDCCKWAYISIGCQKMYLGYSIGAYIKFWHTVKVFLERLRHSSNEVKRSTYTIPTSQRSILRNQNVLQRANELLTLLSVKRNKVAFTSSSLFYKYMCTLLNA